jgi:hypothetical protein
MTLAMPTVSIQIGELIFFVGGEMPWRSAMLDAGRGAAPPRTHAWRPD